MSSYNRGGRGGRGSSNYNSSGRGRGRGGGRGPPHHGPNTHARLCIFFASPTLECTKHNCTNLHAIKCYKDIANSNPDKSSSSNTSNSGYNPGYRGGYNSKQKLHDTSDVAIWNHPSDGIQIFSASHDGLWRLYKVNEAFNKVHQEDMRGKIHCIMVENDILYVGFDGIVKNVPNVTVGMIHAWDLKNPSQPVELHMNESTTYAHAFGVTCFITQDNLCISGGQDAAIRIWNLDPTRGFVLVKECCGHAGDITGLLMVDNILWSCSTDGTIRLWNSGEDWKCKYLISAGTMGNAPAPPPPSTPQNGQEPSGIGHTNAVTGLLIYNHQDTKYVISSSLDGYLKVWNSANAEPVISYNCDCGLMSMALSKDTKENDILIIGCEDGKIMFRNLQGLHLCDIGTYDTRLGHQGGPVRKVISGPDKTFYSAGADGKLIVWQIVGDFKF